MKFPCAVVCIGLGVLGLSGCASYVSKSLPGHITLPQAASSVSVDPGQLPFDRLAEHRFDPADGFDMDEVAMLAVVNNPQLRQARDNLGIARAQSFAAGLLPDPQLGVTFDHPTNGTVGNTNGFNFSPSLDVNAILQRSSRVGAASFEEKRVNLDLLWQEWQVVSQARLLYTRLQAQQQLLGQLESAQRLLADAYSHSQHALSEGNATLDAVSADLAALQTVERQINELQRTRLQNRADLDRLLGLAPGVTLKLVGDPGEPNIDAPAVRATLENRLARRPDMLALQAGYGSQEEKFRGAVLAQFPALNVGLSRARDTSGLYTLGFNLSLSLPIFNANRGNVAIERATRKMLYDQYQDRLNEAAGEIETALDNLPLLRDQLQRTDTGIRQLETVVERADKAFHAGNMTAPDFVRLRTALLDKQTEAINLQEAIAEQGIALETLLGPESSKQNMRHRQ
jgi:cobalt-zinc-cadmium efflux system outer membrane protein